MHSALLYQSCFELGLWAAEFSKNFNFRYLMTLALLRWKRLRISKEDSLTHRYVSWHKVMKRSNKIEADTTDRLSVLLYKNIVMNWKSFVMLIQLSQHLGACPGPQMTEKCCCCLYSNNFPHTSTVVDITFAGFVKVEERFWVRPSSQVS